MLQLQINRVCLLESYYPVFRLWLSAFGKSFISITRLKGFKSSEKLGHQSESHAIKEKLTTKCKLAFKFTEQFTKVTFILQIESHKSQYIKIYCLCSIKMCFQSMSLCYIDLCKVSKSTRNSDLWRLNSLWGVKSEGNYNNNVAA